MSAAVEPFSRVAIVGVGLIGGSVGMALRQKGLARCVAGADRSVSVLDDAVRAGALDLVCRDPAEAVRDADLVVLAAPVGALAGLLEAILPALSSEALVTDVGSVKRDIVTLGESRLGARFVGGHPMAGSERSGIETARADLFDGAAWAIVRPVPFDLASDPSANRLASLVQALGARPILLSSDQHDRLAALVSHLPHALSFAYAEQIDGDPESDLAEALAGGSFRDLTRISHSDPDLWRDIFLANRTNLRAAISEFRSQLDALERSLDNDGSPVERCAPAL